MPLPWFQKHFLMQKQSVRKQKKKGQSLKQMDATHKMRSYLESGENQVNRQGSMITTHHLHPRVVVIALVR